MHLAGAPGEPEPDLDIHRPTLVARFERFYAEHDPLSFKLASTTGGHRVVVTVNDSSNKEVGQAVRQAFQRSHAQNGH